MVTLVFAGLAETLRTRERLRDTSEERGQLLSRTHSLPEVAAFVRQEAQRDAYAGDAALLLRSSEGETWQLLTAEHTFGVPPRKPDEPTTLARWLIEQERLIVISDLAADPRFRWTGGPRALLVIPLWEPEGKLRGLLVVQDRRPARFSAIDLAPLHALAEVAGAALTQAGSYAATEDARARLAGRLAAIERAARDLNSRLEPQEITRKTLAYALLVTRGQAGAVIAYSPDPLCVAEGGTVTPAVSAVLARGAGLSDPVQEPVSPAEPGLRGLVGSRLLAPIRREQRSWGAILVEAEPDAFEPYDAQVLATLADHTAVALENAALLDAVRHERERAEQVIENIGDGLVTLDAAGRVTRMNPAAEQLTGWRAEDAQGQPAVELLRGRTDGAEDEAAHREPPGLVNLLTAPRWRLTALDGITRVLELNAAPLPPPESGIVLLLHDATAEEEMARFQREIVSTFSHELRAPLANIAAIAQLLLAAREPPLEGRARELAQMLQGQTRRLADMAERTLDLARIEAGERRLELRPLPAIHLVEAAIARWRVAAGGRVLHVAQPAVPLWAWADEEAVGSVLDTLIDNALKYTPGDAEIAVSVGATAEGEVVFAVQDCGPGIPPEIQARLFQRFSRGNASDSQVIYGYGLGLYAARLLVQSMGGTIRVESRSGVGSRFSFTLPSPQRFEDDDADFDT